MTRIFLIRHAEAEGNLYRRAQGHYESRVTPKGQRQIAALAERFRNEHIDALYSSDMRRTQLTAGAITKYHDLPLRLDSRLREIYMGSWEDVPWGNLGHDFPQAMIDFNDDPDSWRAEGAETYAQLRERLTGAILEIAARHEGQTVACVSHGSAIRTLLAAAMDIPSREIHRCPHGDNTAVSLLEVENGRIHVVFCNDAGHLSEELSTFARQSWWRQKGNVDRNNVRFLPLDPYTHPQIYTDYYAKTWQAVHGTLEGFQPSVYLACAKQHVKADERALVLMLSGDEAVGITELDTLRGREEGYGWICLCYVEEAFRRSLLGIQLLGHAVSVFRSLGRKSIRLSVFEGNKAAIAFYEASGFRRIGESEGVLGRLYTMEMEI